MSLPSFASGFNYQHTNKPGCSSYFSCQDFDGVVEAPLGWGVKKPSRLIPEDKNPSVDSSLAVSWGSTQFMCVLMVFRESSG